MIKVNIPGRGTVEIKNVVFDYNGTLAVDGSMNQSIKEYILKIKEFLNVYVVTADTYGTVEKECKDLGIIVKTFLCEDVGIHKKQMIEELGRNETLCVGNGFNDIEMFKESIISIGIIGKEGSCGKLIAFSDIVVSSIEDVFEILLNSKRIKATLRC